MSEVKLNNSNNIVDPKEKEKEIQEIKQFISKEIIPIFKNFAQDEKPW